jgi:hypothetical protein
MQAATVTMNVTSEVLGCTLELVNASSKAVLKTYV